MVMGEWTEGKRGGEVVEGGGGEEGQGREGGRGQAENDSQAEIEGELRGLGGSQVQGPESGRLTIVLRDELWGRYVP